MSFIIVLSLLFLILFAVPFVMKRRFGLLGLALAAGGTLSGFWTEDVARLLGEAGLILTAPPLGSVVGAGLVVAPALFVLPKSPAAHAGWRRLLGSAVFALMAIALMLPMLQTGLFIDGAGQNVSYVLAQYRTFIITAGIVVALLDIFFSRTHKDPKPHARH